MTRFIATLMSGAALALMPAIAQEAETDEAESMEEMASEAAEETGETMTEVGDAMESEMAETGQEMERQFSDTQSDMEKEMKDEWDGQKEKAEKDWSGKKADMEKDWSDKKAGMEKDWSETSGEARAQKPGTKTIKRYNADGELVSTETVPVDGTEMRTSGDMQTTESSNATTTSYERNTRMDNQFEDELNAEIDMMNLAQLFIAIDQDNDGLVQKEEWAEWQGRATSATQQFNDVDVDGDGDIEFSEYVVGNLTS